MGRISWYYVNPIATKIPINTKDIEDEKKLRLMQEFEGSIWTEDVLSIEQKLCNIKDIPVIDIIEPRWIMDRLKESVFMYVNGFWVNTIVLCEIICEYVTFLIVDTYYKENGIGFIIQSSRELRNQHDRLSLLKKIGMLKDTEYKNFNTIREIRNKYIHLNKTDDEDENYSRKDNIKQELKIDAKVVLCKLVEILNERKGSK